MNSKLKCFVIIFYYVRCFGDVVFYEIFSMLFLYRLCLGINEIYEGIGCF